MKQNSLCDCNQCKDYRSKNVVSTTYDAITIDYEKSKLKKALLLLRSVNLHTADFKKAAKIYLQENK